MLGAGVAIAVFILGALGFWLEKRSKRNGGDLEAAGANQSGKRQGVSRKKTVQKVDNNERPLSKLGDSGGQLVELPPLHTEK